MSSRERVIGGKSLAVLLALAASLCLAMALAPAGALAATGSISGTVTDAETAEPVEGVEVCAWALSLEDEEEFFGRCGETDASGEYTLAELPNGDYEVEFWGTPQGYLIQFYNGKASPSEADPVTVEGGPVAGIDAELDRGAEIEGTVTRSSDGEPVEEVEVCAWPVGGEEESFGRCTGTESDGSYVIEGLEPGEYKVEFWPVFTGQNLAFQYYDHESRWSEADVLSLEAGETVSGIDAELEAGATISGRVTSAATGTGLLEIPVCSIDAASGELQLCTWTEPDGAYELPFLPSGQDKAVFSINFEEWFGEPGLEGDDGYPTQFWNNQTTLAAANVIPLSTGQSVGGIDARLGTPPPVVTPPVTQPPVVHRKKRHIRCRKGFVKKKVKGKVRCVKRHKHRRHRHRVARPSGYQSPSLPGAGTRRPPFRVVR